VALKVYEVPGGRLGGGVGRRNGPMGTRILEAARRELKEELGVHVQDVGPVELSVRDPGSDFVIDFLPVSIQGDPQCLEHQALTWEEEAALASYDLAPSDRQYVEL
jgi:8-oxo-dGTP pyrophosphatase MutT (NUDIX family)